jgi:hypothetical protein
MRAETQVAETIREQIGLRAFFMLGAKDFVSIDCNALQFKIGRNCKAVTHIRVTLTPMDTYKVTFYRIWGASTTVKSESDNVYVESLHQTIEAGTGMYTSL